MPTADELADADELSAQLIRLVKLIERAHAQYQAEHPDAVERAAFHLLAHLVKDGPRRAGALAEAVCSDPSTISRQVAQLVRLGFVERAADPDDGRASLLVATPEGRRVFEENRRLRTEKIATVTAGWTSEERRTLSRLLGRFVGDFELHRFGAAHS